MPGGRACYRAGVHAVEPTDERTDAVIEPGGGRGWWRVVVTAAVLAAVWWPARPGGADGFPLSSYPMFGYTRAPTSVVDTVLGVGADGQRRPLTPPLLAEVWQPKPALVHVAEAIRHRRAEALCREVAKRVAALPAPERPLALEVVTDTWDTLHALEPGAGPQQRVVHARCEVPR
jgi:hypothetical protein